MMLKVFLFLQFANLLTSYRCDFESQEQRDAWTLNVGRDGAQCTNRWYLGEAGANHGMYGLFISDDAQQATYSRSRVGGVVCYTDIAMQPARYTLSFDWYVAGLQQDTSGYYYDRMYVCWVPTLNEDGDTIDINSRKTALPNWVYTYALRSQQTGKMFFAGARSWSTGICVIDSARNFTGSGPYRLVFVWTNLDSLMVVNPSAKVDNIEILPYRECLAPDSVRYILGNNDVTLTWRGSAAQYEYRCYSHEAQRTYSGVTDSTSVVLTNIPEGRVDFYVRSVCDDIKSYTVSTSGMIYYPGRRCINFLDLNAGNCLVADNPFFSTESTHIKYIHKLVDFGPESEYSRHTVHYDRTEKDPMTNYELSTIPADELASVRLGNRRTGSESERVEYQLHIDAAVNPVLVLKYAIVMENPDEHRTFEQPRFRLRILQNGHSVGNPCAEADFTADGVDVTKDSTWHRWNPGTIAAADIVWKDWTTVGVGLSEYDGQDLVIQLTTYDCSLTGHFGYAYFTLSCSDGKFKDMVCGKVNPVFYAPAGFLYRWYQQDTPGQIISRSDSLMVGYQDTLAYGCDLMFPQDTSCYFTLYANAMPRFPKAEMSYFVSHPIDKQTGTCTNRVRFVEKSHMLVQNHVTGVTMHDYATFPDSTIWTFEDGERWHNIDQYYKTFPDSGGTYIVQIRAVYVTCEDVRYDTIVLPDVRVTVDTIVRKLCQVDLPYIFPSRQDTNYMTVNATGYYTYTYHNQWGCDSILLLDFTVRTDTELVTQRWNDVLAVRNSAYNGGYEFVAFQWMKNGEILPGETSSILYVPGGLDMNAQYTVELTQSDGTVLTTCPIFPVGFSSQDMPVVVDKGASIPMRGQGTAAFFSPLGQCVSRQIYHDSSIEAPSTAGIYLIQSSNHALVQRIVVR